MTILSQAPRNILMKTVIFLFGCLLIWNTPASGAKDICLACHPEKLLEDEKPCSVWMEYGHPVNVVPSSRVRIPKNFLLDEEGKIVCLTCHRLLNQALNLYDSPRIYSSKLSLVTINTNSNMCVLCHIRESAVQLQKHEGQFDMLVEERIGRSGATQAGTTADVEQTKAGLREERTESGPEATEFFGAKLGFNHPVNIFPARVPKKINELGGLTGFKKNQVICQTCHAVHGANEKKLLIYKNTNSELCGICHSKSSARNRREASIKGTHPVNVYPRSAEVSPDILKKGGQLGENGNIVCLTCHAIHGASIEKNLLIIDNKKSRLCLKCHPMENILIKDTKHDLSASFAKKKNIKGNSVEEAGICSSCHVTHNGSGSKMWARPIRAKQDAIADLCLSCHSLSGFAANKLTGIYSHSVGIPIELTGNFNTNLPLFTDIGLRIGKGNVTCSTCHNVHRWDPLSMKKGKKKEGDNTNSFLRIRNIKSILCYECHSSKKTIFKTSHDPGHPIYKNANVPKIMVPEKRDGICDKCHVPHNATSAVLWNRQLGPGGNEITRICSSCHSKGMIAQKHQTGKLSHPVSINIQALGTNISLPLRNERYQKDPRGMMFCDTCHDSHQWDPKHPKRRNEKIAEGDMDTSYLRISARNRKKNLCNVCHKEKRYVEDTDHDLAITAPEEKNAQGKKRTDSGVCGTCHAVHNAQSKFRLWNKEFGEGPDMVSQMCNSCHATGKCAQIKVLTGVSHPIGRSGNMLDITEELYRIILPIYDDGYKIVSRSYRLSSSYYNLDYSPMKIKADFTDTENDYVPKKRVDKISAVFSFLKEQYLNFTKTFTEEKKEAYDIKPEEEKDREGKRKIRIPLKKKKKNRFELQQEKFEKLLEEKLFTDSYAVIDEVLEEKPLAAVYCTSCHNVHKWNPKKNTTGKGINLEGDNNNSFLRISNLSEGKLCVACHKQKGQIVKTDHDLAVTAPKEKNYLGDYPSRTGVCGTCHLVHNAKEENLIWGRKLGSAKDYISKLCFSCHSNGECAEKKQVGEHSHKLGVRMAKADGSTTLPLYNKEGAKVEAEGRGKMSCATCHDLHDWDSRAEGPGDGITPLDGNQNTSFLRIANLETPSLCNDCHQKKGFVINTSHNLSYSAPNEKNRIGKTTGESGVCSPCHLVHNAAFKNNLWAKKLGPAIFPGWQAEYQLKENISVQYCTSCHNNKLAKSVSGEGLHTPNYMFISKEPARYLENPVFPYFDYLFKGVQLRIGMSEIDHGARARYPLFLPDSTRSPNGILTCPTCHNAHQWDPDKPDIKYSESRQANFSNNFLRKDIARRFCPDCHAYNALSKFAFFHNTSKSKRHLPEKNQQSPHWIGALSKQGKCESCHKKTISSTEKHPVNIKFPEKEKTFTKSDKLPLKKGFITCYTCHDPQIQLNEWKQKKDNPNFLRIVNKTKDQGIFGSIGPPGGFGMSSMGGGRGTPPGKSGGNASSLSLAAGVMGRGHEQEEKKTDYPLCFECHIIDNFTPFNPHVNQLNMQGKVNKDMCLICHIEVPNRWLRDEENFKLRRDISHYCVGCHQGKTELHPADRDHYNKHVTGPYAKTYEITTKKNNSYLPLKEAEIIVCPTCHNPHDIRTVMDPSAQSGGDSTARLRVTGKTLCISCHFESRAPKKTMTPF